VSEPQTMGGGTYARVMPNLVAIGAGFEGDGRAHEPDELFSRVYFPLLHPTSPAKVEQHRQKVLVIHRPIPVHILRQVATLTESVQNAQ
jgi:hypothetical protein